MQTDIIEKIELFEREDEQTTEEIKAESSEKLTESSTEDTEEDLGTEVTKNTEVKGDTSEPIPTEIEEEKKPLGSTDLGQEETQPSHIETETELEKEDIIESDSENSGADNSELVNNETKETPTMTVSYEKYLVPPTDADATVYAVTSIGAESVTLKGKNGTKEYDAIYMKTEDGLHWYIDIDLFEAGTFVITITAYFVDGQTTTEQIEIIYPYY